MALLPFSNTRGSSSGGGTPGGSSGQIQWNSSSSFAGVAGSAVAASGNIITLTAPSSTDTPIVLKGASSQSANLLEVQNSSGDVKVEVYDTTTMYLNRVTGSDYERIKFEFDFSSGIASIGTEAGGSGLARGFKVYAASTLTLLSNGSTLLLQSGGESLSIVGSGAGFDWNNLSSSIRFYANGNSGTFTMRSPTYFGDGSTGGLTVFREITTNAGTSELADAAAMAIYRKADKFVLAYNIGGTVYYTTLDLDGSDTTFTTSTTAP